MSYMKQPCKHCPFRHDVKPFLTPERGEELAYAAINQYNSFPCHKTTEHDEDGDAFCTEETKECAGFMTLQHNETGCSLPDDFTPSELVYTDTWDMIDAYNHQNE